MTLHFNIETKMLNEETPLLLPSNRNNNGIREFETRKSVTRRTVFFLIGVIGCVGIVSTIVIFTSHEEVTGVVVPLTRSLRSTKSNILTVDGVRQLAKEYGSTALNSSKPINEICDTQGCLDSAIHLLNSINFSVNPCDDFFDFACGRWIAQNKIPASASRWSQFNVLREEVNRITQEILKADKVLEDPKPVNQVKDFYKGCVDIEALEVVGVKPVRDTLQLPNHGDWPILLGSHWKLSSFDWISTISYIRRIFLDTVIISVYVDQDLKNSNAYATYIDQPSLILPRDILINEDGSYDHILEAYKEYIVSAVDVFVTADKEDKDKPEDEDVQTQAQNIVDFEAKIASMTTKDELRTDTERMYNAFTIPQFQALTDSYGDLTNHLGVGLNWFSFLSSIFQSSGVTLSTDNRVIVLEKEYFAQLIPLLLATEPRTVANYIQLRYVSGLGGETTKRMREIAFKFNQVLSGAKEPPTREKTCADSSNNGFGMAIGVKYIDEANFDEQGKTEVNTMVKDLRISFKQLLAEASWMDSVTKTRAQEKADKMKSFMAYPDWMTNKTALEKYYANVEIVPTDYFESVSKLSQWSGDKALANLHQPVDREYWLTYPGVVNAFYAPTYNSITFPTGILQPPFFRRGYPAFLNYGGIGVVIGHEITHGFDNSGRQYDAEGNASPWWTNETLTQYTEKANCIRDQYSAYKPPEVDLHVNGLLTLGENIADNGGLRESYLAYKKYVSENGVERRLPGLEQFDPEQLFFMGYANIWCEAITVQGLTNQLLTDPHSPTRFRVRGPLSNNADFLKKWQCPLGSVMNPGPDHKCTLW